MTTSFLISFIFADNKAPHKMRTFPNKTGDLHRDGDRQQHQEYRIPPPKTRMDPNAPPAISEEQKAVGAVTWAQH